MNEYNKIILGDCLEKMKDIEDKSIDLIFTDLPFGTTQNKWDCIIPLEPLWHQYERIIKDNGCIALFAQTPFDKVLGASNLKLLKYEWIWEKNRPSGHLNAKKMPMKAHENILIFYKKPPIYNPQMTTGHEPLKPTYSSKKLIQTNYGDFDCKVSERQKTGGQTTRYPRDILKFNVIANGNLHPCEKPVSICEYFLKTYSNEGDTILDNCTGSGSIPIACLNTNRKYIAIEKNEQYYNIAVNRISGYIHLS